MGLIAMTTSLFVPLALCGVLLLLAVALASYLRGYRDGQLSESDIQRVMWRRDQWQRGVDADRAEDDEAWLAAHKEIFGGGSRWN